jgi:hypothetical protein
MDLHRHSKYFGNIWQLFGVLFSICVFVGTPKNRLIFGLLFVLQIKKMNTQIKKWSFCMRIRVLVQTNHFLATQIHKRRLQMEKAFAQKKNHLLCICVLVYRGKEITASMY